MRNNGLGGTPKAASVPRLPGFRDRVPGRTSPCALCNNWRVRMSAECGALSRNRRWRRDRARGARGAAGPLGSRVTTEVGVAASYARR